MRNLAFVSFILFLVLCLTESEGLEDAANSIFTELFPEENVENDTSISKSEVFERDELLEARKRKKGGLQQIYMIFMMWKALISTLLMLLSPIIQVKNLGLTALGTAVSIARLVMELKEKKQQEAKEEVVVHGHDRIGVDYRPVLQPYYVKRITITE